MTQNRSTSPVRHALVLIFSRTCPPCRRLARIVGAVSLGCIIPRAVEDLLPATKDTLPDGASGQVVLLLPDGSSVIGIQPVIQTLPLALLLVWSRSLRHFIVHTFSQQGRS